MKTITEVQFLGLGEWVAQEERIGCPARELRFGLRKILGRAWRYETESAWREFTLGGERIIRQIPGVMIFISSHCAAGFFSAAPSEPNQTPEPTIRAGTPRAEPR